MGRKSNYICEDCGIPVRRHRNGRTPWTCAECGIKRAGNQYRALASKRGPVYIAHLRRTIERCTIALVIAEMQMEVENAAAERAADGVRAGSERESVY